jgi:ribosomal protein S18 acetylase RimI-like enzyme
MELSTKLPADAVSGSPAQLVVGSLDINQGAVLPAEELVGKQPQELQAQRRAYLSNICVAQGARRQGIAAALMAEAEQVAAGLGEVIF